MQPSDLFFENATLVGELGNFGLVIFTPFPELGGFLVLFVLLGGLEGSDFLVEPLDFLGESNFLHLELGAGDFQFGFVLAELFDGFSHMVEFGVIIFDSVFVMVFHPGLAFGEASVYVFVFLSEGFDSLLKLGNSEFVLVNLFFVELHLFGRRPALYEGLDFVLEVLVVLEMLFDSFLEFFVFLSVKVNVIQVVLHDQVGRNVPQL